MTTTPTRNLSDREVTALGASVVNMDVLDWTAIEDATPADRAALAARVAERSAFFIARLLEVAR